MAKLEPKQIDTTSEEVTEREAEYVLDQRNIAELEDETRDFIAKRTLSAFFWLLAIILVGAPIYNAIITANHLNDNLLIDLSDLLQQYGSILGPVLGFVIGYYFKTKSS
jgi:prolipoprotein diacylglyceryltransferase